MSLVWIVVLMTVSLALVLYIAFGKVRRWLVIAGFWLVLGLGVIWGTIEMAGGWPSSRVPSVFFWLTIAIILATGIFTWLWLRGGHNYSVNDTEAHASDYGHVIKEGHGGLTAFLWISYAVIFIWTIVYLAQHWSEFGVIFSY
jgi:hypothetical protein